MKVRFTANTSFDDNFPGIQYGFTHYGKLSQSAEDSFGIKLFEKLDKYFQSFKTLNSNESSIIHCLYDSVEYITKETDLKLVNNFGVHINTTTSLNKYYTKLFSRLLPFSRFSQIFSEQEAAYIANEQIVIGIGLFNGKSTNNFIQSLYKDMTAQDLSQLIFFHELGHSLEISNLNIQSNYSSSMQHFFECLKSYGTIFSENECSQANKRLRQYNGHSQFSMLNHEFITTLSALKGEMYADVSSLLLKRNFDIQKIKFTPDSFNNYIISLSNSRQSDIFPRLKNLDFGFNRLSFEYHTSPALHDLTHNNLLRSNKLLTQYEIHEICQKQVQQGMSRILYTIMSADNSIHPQIFHLINTKNIQNKKTDNYFYDFFTDIEEQVGQEWLKNFKHLESIKNYDQLKTPSEKNIAIFTENLFHHYEVKSHCPDLKKTNRYYFPQKIKKSNIP